MTLSIIIVNWNTREMLYACLASVYMTLADLEAEVIVVDNGSDDGSTEMVLGQFPSVVLIANEENRGFAAANNQALKIASGNYLLLLNSDTLVHGDVLKQSVTYMKKNSGVGVMGCRVLNTDGSLQPTCSQFPSLINLLLLTSGLWKLPWFDFLDRYQMRRWQRTDERDVDVVSGCYMLVRAEAIKETGLLDEEFFFFGEETDWCRRFQQSGWQLRFAPVGEITHHGGGSVRKLNHKRDIMLSSATVKLHLKHKGIASGMAAWTILLVFNVSRALFWTAASAVISAELARRRRKHFVSLVRDFHRVWPTGRTYAQ